LANRVHRHHTRAHYLAAQDNRAGSTLRHSAPELRPTQPKLIGQNEQQRRSRVEFESVQTSIHLYGNRTHAALARNLKLKCSLGVGCNFSMRRFDFQRPLLDTNTELLLN
jgi:hypothetical protein